MPVTTLKDCYQFDPGYGTSIQDQAHVKGIMGTLWGEAMQDINQVTYMAYPRALALAEAGWTQMKYHDWKSFKQRLEKTIRKYSLCSSSGTPIVLPDIFIKHENERYPGLIKIGIHIY